MCHGVRKTKLIFSFMLINGSTSTTTMKAMRLFHLVFKIAFLDLLSIFMQNMTHFVLNVLSTGNF